jgi:carnitine O-acetyltransferase
MLHDFVYTVRVCEDDRRPLPVQTIEDRIRAVVLDVIKRIESGESAVPVGVLTSDDRDRWAGVSVSFNSYFSCLSCH